jgi:YrbI family 3-deoxy-D-manno-octulosonate 8-phosphate phosphatase
MPDMRHKKVMDSGINYLKNHKIGMVITDVDGVLTDGSMYYSENGELLKGFNTRDGMGFELLELNNIITVILTKEPSKIVVTRAKKIRVNETHVGVENKLAKGLEIINKYKISPGNVAFIGDDINDIPLLEIVGFPCCPSDAEEEVKKKVKYVCKKPGGGGVLREVANMVIRSNKNQS